MTAVVLVAPRPWSHRLLSRRRFHRLARLCGIGAGLEMVIFARLTDLIPRWEAAWRALAIRAAIWPRRPLREQLTVVIRGTARGLRLAIRRFQPPVFGGASEPEPSAKVRARRAAHRPRWAVYERVNRIEPTCSRGIRAASPCCGRTTSP